MNTQDMTKPILASKSRKRLCPTEESEFPKMKADGEFKEERMLDHVEALSEPPLAVRRLKAPKRKREKLK